MRRLVPQGQGACPQQQGVLQVPAVQHIAHHHASPMRVRTDDDSPR
jgi:hypothetical protein